MSEYKDEDPVKVLLSIVDIYCLILAASSNRANNLCSLYIT